MKTITSVGLILVMVMTVAAIGDEPDMRNWKSFPVPHGTPQTARPSDAELLKVVPPMRAVPQFSDEASDLGIALWWGDYSEIQFMEQPPSQTDLDRPGMIQTPPGEHEPLLLGVWGITRTGPVSLFVEDSPFPLTIRHLEFEPHYVPTPYSGRKTEGGRVVGFATYLPEQGIAYIRQGERSVFWINVEVPATTPPGEYDLTFKMIVHQKEIVYPQATVKVIDLKLPRADAAFGMYFRPGHLDPRYRKPHLMRAYWRDMAQHGMTSATIYNYAGAIYDEQGRPKLDGNRDIQTLKDMMADGLVTSDIPIMWLGGSLGNVKDKSTPAIQAEFKRRGWPELLSYSQDEPSISEKNRLHFESEIPLRKYFRTVTAISDYASYTYADMLDVHVVHGGQISPELQQHLENHGAEVWTYSCKFRGRGNAPQHRFYAGLYTWALRLKGNFLWCYGEIYGWEGERYAVYNHVLASDSGPIPSVAWEARREGIEDYRTMRYLESLIAANPQRSKAKEAEGWLEQIRGRVDWYLARDMPVSDYPWDSIELYPTCANFEPAELTDVRAQAVEYISDLIR